MATLPGSSPLRVDVGQLAGRLSNRIDWYGNVYEDDIFIVLTIVCVCLCFVVFCRECDGTTERASASWLVVAKAGTTVEALASHQRAGRARKSLTLSA
jgi:hypothetical protein